MPTGRRHSWVDLVKGLAILLVVIGHTLRGLDARNLVPESLFAAVDSRIYAFHMPVFFALSGLFILPALARRTTTEFIVGRIERIFWPMVIWTYLFLAAKALAGPLANEPISFSDLLIWPVPGRLHLWFLWALFLLHMAILVVKPLLRSANLALPALMTLAVVSVALSLMPVPGAFAYWIGSALRYSPYLVLGIILGSLMRAGRGPERLPIRFRIVAAGTFIVTLIFWNAWPESDSMQLLGGLILTTCFLIMLAGFEDNDNAGPIYWLCSLGRASMVIYLGHTLFSAALREGLLSLGVASFAVHVVFGIVIGVLGPLLLLKLARITGTERVLGF